MSMAEMPFYILCMWAKINTTTTSMARISQTQQPHK